MVNNKIKNTTRSMQKIDSIDLLNEIVSNRKWYYNNQVPIFSRHSANVYKKRLLEKKLTKTTAEKILIKLGWQKKTYWVKENL